jgi:arylsulfatase A-like enzyme
MAYYGLLGSAFGSLWQRLDEVTGRVDMRHRLVSAVVLSSSVLLSVISAQAAEEPPNILLIQADDLGYCDLGVTGNKYIKTPNLDTLGRESVRFTQYYVHSVCAPTRASLMTGKHFWRTGVTGVHGGTDFMNLNETTIAEVLRGGGYSTGMWGKWHSGKTDGYFPWDRGFDEAYMAKLYSYTDNAGLMNGTSKPSEGWTPAVLTDYAIDFIRRKKDRPFFAYVPYLSPHGVWKAPEEYVAPYLEAGSSESTAILFGMITHLDRHIGRLLRAVDELGLRESTLVLFMSDNGPIQEAQLSMTDEEWAKRIEPLNLRGNKGTIYENGIRSPLFIRWGNRLAPVNNDRLLCVMDIFPTLAELAGTTVPGSVGRLDGKSFRRLLFAPEAEWPDRELFFSSPSPNSPNNENKYRATADKSGMTAKGQRIALRTDRYKCLQPQDKFELFDIRKDPREENNLAMDSTELGKSMGHAIEPWFNMVLQEPGSFTRPVMFVGYQGREETTIPAYCASEVEGQLSNNAHGLDKWGEPGDTAYFELDVRTAGRYLIDLDFKKLIKGPAELSVTADEQTIRCAVPEGKSARTISSRKGLQLPTGRTTLAIQLDTELPSNYSMASVAMRLEEGR